MNFSSGVWLKATRVDQQDEGWFGPVDEQAHEFKFSNRKGTSPPPLTYTMPDADHLTLSDTQGKWLLSLRKLAPHEYLLQTRGFRWVSEEPFNK